MESSYLLILLSIFVWSTQAFVTKIVVTGIGFFSVYVFASLFTAITAFAFYFVLNRKKIDFGFLMHPGRIILVSIFLTLANFLLFSSFGMVPASNVIILLYIYPILMSILHSVIFKIRLTKREILGLSMGFIGVFLFATSGNPMSLHFSNPVVDIMIIIAAFSWAFYLVLQKKYRFEEFSSNGVAFLLSTLYALPLIILVPTLLPHGLILPNLNVFMLLIYFSIVTFAIGNVAYVKGLKNTKVVNTALLTYLTPILAVILDYLVLGESIYWYDLLPLLFIFLGYFAIRWKKGQITPGVHEVT